MEIEVIQRSIITASRVQHEYYRKLMDIFSQINATVLAKNFEVYEWMPIVTAYPPGGPRGFNLNRWALDLLPLNNFLLQWSRGPANTEGFVGIHVIHVIDSGINRLNNAQDEYLPANYSPIDESFTYLKVFVTRYEKGAKAIDEEIWKKYWHQIYEDLYGLKWAEYVAFQNREITYEENKIKTTSACHKLGAFATMESLRENILTKIELQLG